MYKTGVDYAENDQYQEYREHAVPMKSVSEAIYLRNNILKSYEQALNHEDGKEVQALMNVVVVGGGPTGVELSGALAEMKKYILPKDYPELDFSNMTISLLEAGEYPHGHPQLAQVSIQQAQQLIRNLVSMENNETP